MVLRGAQRFCWNRHRKKAWVPAEDGFRAVWLGTFFRGGEDEEKGREGKGRKGKTGNWCHEKGWGRALGNKKENTWERKETVGAKLVPLKHANHSTKGVTDFSSNSLNV